MSSSTERMQKYRERIKKDPEKYAQYLEKKRQDGKKNRKTLDTKMKANPLLREINRQKTREKVQAFRERQKLNKSLNSVSPIGTYKCLQTFGKAVRKLKSTLPASPMKRLAVVKKIANDVLGDDVALQNKTECTKKMCTEETKKDVINFYYRDDISRQAPGKKDYKSVLDEKTRKRIKKQKRTMVMTIREAYELFQTEYPEKKMSKTAFYGCRPKEVIPVAYTEHVVCVCAQHANFINKIETVGKCIKGFPKTHTELVKQTSCDPEKESCMTGTCKRCPKTPTWSHSEEDMDKIVSWKEWINLGGRPKQNTKSSTCAETIALILQDLPKFKLHSFIKKIQSYYFQQSIKNLGKNEAVVQIDFAENYALVSQDEIQSAHWNHDQVTVFTCCVWLANDERKSIVIVSDDTKHTKYAVWAFLKRIFDHLQSFANCIESVKLFSDNCAAQFKNRYILSLLEDLKVYAQLLHLEWAFFAASHGKGAVDGIGGTIKRSAWIGVKSRKVILNTAEEFFLYVKGEVKGIDTFYVSKKEIEEEKATLDHIWKQVLAIKNLQTMHYFQAINDTEIVVARSSMSTTKKLITVKVQPLHEVGSDWSDDDLLPLSHAASLTIKNSGHEYGSSKRELLEFTKTRGKHLRLSEVYTDSEDETIEFDGGVIETVNRIKKNLMLRGSYDEREKSTSPLLPSVTPTKHDPLIQKTSSPANPEVEACEIISDSSNILQDTIKEPKRDENIVTETLDSVNSTNVAATAIKDDTPMILTNRLHDAEIQQGSWVITEYKCHLKKNKPVTKNYVGQIINIENEGQCKTYTVRSLRRVKCSRNVFTWPSKDDDDKILRNAIIKVLKEPTTNRRGQLYFEHIEEYDIE